MTASEHKQIWESMQKRLNDVQQRQALIPDVDQVRKEVIILRLQVSTLETQPLSDQYQQKRDELSAKEEAFKQLQKQYQELADREMEILKQGLHSVTVRINGLEVYDLDLEDHRSAIERSIRALDDEMSECLRSLPV